MTREEADTLITQLRQQGCTCQIQNTGHDVFAVLVLAKPICSPAKLRVW